jgi:RecA-family ATPase
MPAMQVIYTRPANIAACAAQLASLGYWPVPIPAGRKGPDAPGWQNLRLTPAECLETFKGGMLVGILHVNTCVIDIDVTDPTLAAKLCAEARLRFPGALERVGQAPKSSFWLRMEPAAPFSISNTRRGQFTDADGEHFTGQVEVRAGTGQAVAYGKHPVTQAPYQWVNGPELYATPWADLALASKDAIQSFRDWADGELAIWSDIKEESPRPTGGILHNFTAPLDRPPEAEFLAALKAVSSDTGYDDWLAGLMAIHDYYGGGGDGLTVAHEWSRPFAGYDPREVEQKWRSFTPGKGVSYKTIFGRAKAAGADLGALVREHRPRAEASQGVSPQGGADTVAAIWQSMLAKFGPVAPDNAEGRAAVDNFLRHEMAGIADRNVRMHAAEMIRDRRHAWFTGQTEIRRLKKDVGDVEWYDDLQPALAAAYLVKGILDAGAMSVVYGPSNSGKTFFAMDIAFHIATGRAWRGNRVTAAPVLYLAAEGGRGVTNRIVALRQEAGAHGVPLALKRAGLDLLHNGADIEAVVTLAAEVQAKAPDAPLLIVIDTLSRVMAGGDENSAADMTALIRNIDAIRAATNAHVMLIHHTGKDTARGARGHSSLRAATDTEIEVSSEEGNRLAMVTKQRDNQGGETFAFTLKTVSLGTDQDGDEVTSCVVEIADTEEVEAAMKRQRGLGGNQKIIADTFDQMLAEGMGRPNPGGIGFPEPGRYLTVQIDDLKRLSMGKMVSANPRVAFYDAWKALTDGRGLFCAASETCWRLDRKTRG